MLPGMEIDGLKEATIMLKLNIKHTSQQLRNTFDNGFNSVISLETPEGDVLLGGTFAQRAWLSGDDTQGLSIEKRQQITQEELEELRYWDGHIYVFEDTLYLVSSHQELDNIKYPFELLDTFEKGGIEITDLR